MSRNRWDDEYASYQEDQPENRQITVDPTADNGGLYLLDSRYDG